jgi:hypothetical protein
MKRTLKALQAILVIGAVAVSGNAWADDAAGDASAMAGAYYMRDTLVPRSDDLALIQRKPALYVSSFNDEMATVAYSVSGGRLVYRVVKGELGESTKAEIDKALVKLQRKLA